MSAQNMRIPVPPSLSVSETGHDLHWQDLPLPAELNIHKSRSSEGIGVHAGTPGVDTAVDPKKALSNSMCRSKSLNALAEVFEPSPSKPPEHSSHPPSLTSHASPHQELQPVNYLRWQQRVSGRKRREKARSRSLNALPEPTPTSSARRSPFASYQRFPSKSRSKSRFKSYSSPGFDETDAQPFVQGNGNGVISSANAFDPFVSSSTPLASSSSMGQQVQANPYSQDAGSIGGAAYYQGHSNFQQPVSRD